MGGFANKGWFLCTPFLYLTIKKDLHLVKFPNGISEFVLHITNTFFIS